MKLRFNVTSGYRQSSVGLGAIKETAYSGTEVKVIRRAPEAETSMGASKVEVQLPNGNRVIVNSYDLNN